MNPGVTDGSQPLTPLAHPHLDLFLLGFIAACSGVAALFFLRFWKQTRDLLFLAFAVFFLVEGLQPVAALSARHPNQLHLWAYLVRLFSIALVLAAILRKNYRQDASD